MFTCLSKSPEKTTSAKGAYVVVQRDIPYSPSFILDLAKAVDSKIRNVVDFVLLPGFNKPTIAVLWQSEMTWPG